MKKRVLKMALVLVLIFSLSACTDRPTHRVEMEQPTPTTSPTETPVWLPSQLTPTSIDEQPRWALPPNVFPGEIAYLSDRTGLAEIWLLDLVTGLEKQLTETLCGDTSVEGRVPEWYTPGVQGFTWSPDGQRIAYLVQCSYVDFWTQLHIYDFGMALTISITSQADDKSYPSWDPSGNQIVFSVIRQGDAVYITDIEGPDTLKTDPITRTLCAFPVWSPDGKHIAYRGPALGLPGSAGSRTYISIVDPEWNHLEYDPPFKSTLPDLPDTRSGWLAAPVDEGLTWSHSAQYLAVATVRAAVPGSLGLVDITGKIAHRRSGGLVQMDSNSFGRDFYNPVFSPDDETLYFVSVWPDTEYGVRFGTIYSVLVQDILLGSSSLDIPVTSVSPKDQLAGFPSLSPDGEWLIYAVKVGKATEVWLQAIDGTYRQRLVGDGFVNTRPAWRPLDK